MSEKGPCVMCGATDYPLSMGGPSICPACDCGVPPTTSQARREIADLRRQLSAALAVIDRLRLELQTSAGMLECSSCACESCVRERKKVAARATKAAALAAQQGEKK